MREKVKKKGLNPKEYRQKMGYKLVGTSKHGLLWLTPEEIKRAKKRQSEYQKKHPVGTW